MQPGELTAVYCDCRARMEDQAQDIVNIELDDDDKAAATPAAIKTRQRTAAIASELVGIIEQRVTTAMTPAELCATHDAIAASAHRAHVQPLQGVLVRHVLAMQPVELAIALGTLIDKTNTNTHT